MLEDVTVLPFFVFSLLFFIFLCKKLFEPYNYWVTKGIRGPKPIPIFGNYAPVFFGLKTEAEVLREIYENHPNDFIGIYKGFKRVLLIKNPETIKQVLLKDFDCFSARCIENSLKMYGHSLFVMEGDENWRKWRRLFAPGLLSDRIQKMIPLVNYCLDKHLKRMDDMIKDNNTLTLRKIQDQFVLDVFNKLIFNRDYKTNDATFSDVVTAFIQSKLEISFLSEIKTNDNTTYILRDFVKNIIDEIESNGAKRNNFVEFMVGMKLNGKTRKDKEIPVNMDNDAIIQQSLTFFLTAFESTAGVMAFVLYELANNQAIQEKCFDEIYNVLKDDKKEYTAESLSKLKYISMVIDETMRKHTVSQVIDRKCSSKYTFAENNLTIDENCFVFVPVHGLHNDPKYFPNPEVFDPERFLEDKKGEIPQYVYLPFGDGPRMCIGK